MDETTRRNLSHLGPLTEVVLTHRFATYRGTLDGESVFVKAVVDTELVDRIQSEVAGMNQMKLLDVRQDFYSYLN